MSQPTAYTRQFNFTQHTATQPTTPLPGASVDLEYNTIKTTLDQILINLNLIQRDDGQLENRSVGRDQLRTDVLTEIGALDKAIVTEFVFDIAAPSINTLSGNDRNSKTLAYQIGATVSIHIDGVKTDPANITATDGINIVHATDFPDPSVVVVEVTEASTFSTVDVESLDDISSQFDGIATVFEMKVGGNARTATLAERLTVSLDDVIQEPTAKFTVSGTQITFITAPATATPFWAKLRTLVTFEAGTLSGTVFQDDSIPGSKIAPASINADRLSFSTSSLEIGGGYDWYDDILPANAPAGSVVFGVGQTIGKPGSGASLTDAAYQEAFDIFKKRWGNLGTEDFDSLDVVKIPDLRGTQLISPDKGKGKISLLNAVGNQSGTEDHSINATISSGTTVAASTGVHTLTGPQSGIAAHSHVGLRNETSGTKAPGAEAVVTSVQDNVTGITGPTTASTSHFHSIPALALTGNATQVNVLHLDPYTVAEKLIRLK